MDDRRNRSTESAPCLTLPCELGQSLIEVTQLQPDGHCRNTLHLRRTYVEGLKLKLFRVDYGQVTCFLLSSWASSRADRCKSRLWIIAYRVHGGVAVGILLVS